MSATTHQPSYADDKAAIEDLMSRYLFALDWNDFDTFINTFTKEAEFEYARGTAIGHEDILTTVKAFKTAIGGRYKDEAGNPAVLRHILGQTVIRVEGDRAWTRAFWWEMANNGPGDTPLVGTFGIYEDDLLRVYGEWKFSRRRVLNDFLPGREPGKTNPVIEMDAVAEKFV